MTDVSFSPSSRLVFNPDSGVNKLYKWVETKTDLSVDQLQGMVSFVKKLLVDDNQFKTSRLKLSTEIKELTNIPKTEKLGDILSYLKKIAKPEDGSYTVKQYQIAKSLYIMFIKAFLSSEKKELSAKQEARLRSAALFIEDETKFEPAQTAAAQALTTAHEDKTEGKTEALKTALMTLINKFYDPYPYGLSQELFEQAALLDYYLH